MTALSADELVLLAEQTFEDTEQAIAALEAGLEAEGELQAWPLAEDRLLIRGKLLLRLGESYYDRREGGRADNREKALAACADALKAVARECFPAFWAQVQHNIGRAYWGRIRGNLADNLERAIAHHEAALTIRTRKDFPTDWAKTQTNLAVVYRHRIRGDPAENLERAIAACEAALTVRTRAAFPTDWAATQDNLANAYVDRIRGERADNLERAITCFEAALTVHTRDSSPTDWAMLQNNLANACRRRIRGERADNLERAIAYFEAALTVYTREAFPADWAMTQNNLAIAYANRVRDEPADNLERAISHYEAALAVYSREAYPTAWAATQNNLANAYADRIRGERADNLERAIAYFEAALTVHTRDSFPTDWAMIQNNLANAYRRRIRGERADNLERAISYFEAALTVYARETFPTDWAMTQNNLAIAYANRIRGERADNIERAIAHYEAALTVYTRETFPTDWAMTQNNLAIACANRIRGERTDNIEGAIAHDEAALTVYTRETFPADWAMTQNNLAIAYANRIRGERADNIEHAIAHDEAALTVHTREAFPENWAMTQNNLANAYRRRARGERADNIEHAITRYEAALTVYTREAFPTDWAKTQNNLAIAYVDRIRGQRAANLELAIAHYKAALTVYTREAFPTDWAMTQYNIANAYADRVRGERADNLERAITHYEAALTIHTRDTFPEYWALTQNNLAGACAMRIRGDRADNLERAISGYESALTVHTREAFPRGHLETCQSLGQAFLAQSAWHKAATALSAARETFLLLFGQGLDEPEAHGLIEIAGSLFNNAAYAAAELGEPIQAFQLVCEGKARLLATALRLQTLDLPHQSRRRLEALRTEIGEQSRRLERAKGLERAEVLNGLKLLRAELYAIIAAAEEISGKNDVLAQASSLVADGGALVASIVTEVGGKLVLVTAAQNPDPPLITIIDVPELTTERLKVLMHGDTAGATQGWLAAFARDMPWRERRTRATRAVEGIGTELWSLLAGPLDRALSGLGVAPRARLIFMPSGGLGLLPLGLAQEPATGRRLLESYEIVYAPSLSALAKAAPKIEKPTASSLAAVINPTGDLIFAPIEGALVAAHFDDESRTILDARTATPEAVLMALKGKTHWHFSTHGTFDVAVPRDSALAMKDGARLSVGSLLQADGLGHPRLVVLSACETALYDIVRTPEEFIGLPGTFLTIGAQAVLGTLWPVDDRATALLMARFYDLHLDEGFAPATALRKAQLWLRFATPEDLGHYACAAEAHGRLRAHETRQLELVLAGTAGEALRYFEGMNADTPDGSGAACGAPPPETSRPNLSFAHPVYWGGFIITGL